MIWLFENDTSSIVNKLAKRSPKKILWRRSCPVPVPASGNGTVHSGIVWYGAAPVCLDGPQAEKAIPDRADADAGVGCI